MNLLSGLFRSLAAKPASPKSTLYDIYLASCRQDLDKWHHYFDVYERYFAPYRGKPISILEIGLWRGGSLRMWREYFGPRVRLYGADVNPECAAYTEHADRIFIGSQSDRTFLREIKAEVGELDIVIDDGGHTMAQQIVSFEELYPVTRQVYVVEDTHTSYWAKFRDAGPNSFMDFAKGKVDQLHEWHLHSQSFKVHGMRPDARPETPSVSAFCSTTRAVHFYDSMVVFEKGENEPRWHEVR